MVIFSVFYPAAKPTAKKQPRFDHDYFDQTHIPLVKEAFAATGLKGVLVLKGVSAGDGGPAPYLVQTHLSFDSAEALQASVNGPRGAEVLADIAAFTDAKPLTQVSSRSPT